jgi:hypothetical protein
VVGATVAAVVGATVTAVVGARLVVDVLVLVLLEQAAAKMMVAATSVFLSLDAICSLRMVMFGDYREGHGTAGRCRPRTRSRSSRPSSATDDGRWDPPPT